MFYVEHGTAIGKIVDAIQSSTRLGNCAAFVDAEGGDRSARTTTNIPWCPQAPMLFDETGILHHSSLPDIILFPKIDSKYISDASFRPTSTQKEITLLDITYTDDTTVKNRYQEKLDHHNPYYTHLIALGWRVKLYPIVLTYSGCVSASLRSFLDQDCGLTPTAINTLIKSLQQHSYRYNSKLSSTRSFQLKKLITNLQNPTGVG